MDLTASRGWTCVRRWRAARVEPQGPWGPWRIRLAASGPAGAPLGPLMFGAPKGAPAKPDVLLMDERYGALDALTRRRMQDELLQLCDDVRFTLVFVTHSIEEAVVVGSRIVVLSPHPGQARAELNCGRPCGRGRVPGPLRPHLDHAVQQARRGPLREETP